MSFISISRFSIALIGFLLLVQSGACLHFRQFDLSNGLNTLTIHQVICASDGVKWLATDIGILRFDGREFSYYSESQGVVPGQIFGIEEDNEGRIWAFSYSRKLMIYNALADSFEQLAFNQELSTSIEWIFTKLAFSGDSLIISARMGSRVVVTDPLGIAPKVHVSRDFSAGFYLEETSLGEFSFWRGQKDLTSSDFFHWIRPSGDTLSTQVAKPLYSTIQTAYWSADLESYFVTSHDGVLKVDVEMNSTFYPLDYRLTRGVYLNDDGALWLGTFGNGLLVYRDADLSSRPEIYLKGTSVTSICSDGAGGIWVSTLKNGLFYVPNHELQCIETYESGTLLPSNVLGWGEQLFVKHNENAVSRIVKQANGSHVLEPELKLERAIQHVVFDGEKLLWNSGQSRAGNDLAALATDYSEWKKPYVSNQGMVCSERGCLRLVCKSGMLSVEIKSDTLDTFLEWPTSISRIKSVFLTENGNAFIAEGSNRLHWVDFKSGQAEILAHLSFQQKEVKQIMSIAPGIDLVLFTGNEFVEIDVKTRQTVSRTVSSKDGLSINSFTYPSAVGGYLFSTNHGLMHAMSIDDTFELLLNESLGLSSDQVLDCELFNGVYFVVTAVGLCLAEQGLAHKALRKPKVLFRNVRLGNRSLKNVSHLEVERGFSELVFELMSDEQGPEKKTFRYRLNPNQPWYIADNATVRLSLLDPDDYRLEFQASNQKLQWGESNVVALTVYLPIWARWWFITLEILFGLAIVFWVFWMRLNQIREGVRLREDLMQMQSRALSSQLKPHFMFNAMNALISLIVSGKVETSVRYLSGLANLMRGVFENSQKPLVTVQTELDLLEKYVQLEQLRFDFVYQLDHDSAQGLLQQRIPALLLQPLVENAIFYGVSRVEKGEIKLSFANDDETFRCFIQNTGNGEVSDRLDDQFSGATESSIGLIRRRLKLIAITQKVTVSMAIRQEKEFPHDTIVTLEFPKLNRDEGIFN